MEVVIPGGRSRWIKIGLGNRRQSLDQFMPHGPGPPQRPHIPPEAEGADALPDSLPTAKTLKVRAVCFDPQCGQTTPAVLDIDLISRSNDFLQDLQLYS
jgi:hypothetical protein